MLRWSTECHTYLASLKKNRAFFWLFFSEAQKKEKQADSLRAKALCACLPCLSPPPPERDPPRILGKKKKKPDPETKPLLFSQQLERRKKPYEGRAEATAQLQIRPNKRSPFFLLCVRALPPKVQSQRALPPPLLVQLPPHF